MIAAVCALVITGPQQLSRPALDIPNATWEPIFFGDETDPQTIHGRAKISKLENLRAKKLPKGVTEIRFWEGFGVTYLQGYRFRSEAGKWRAWKIEPALTGRKDLKAKNYLTELKPPTKGWNTFWQAMNEQKFFTLPDFDSLPGKKAMVSDGMCYVVEFQREGKYRTYCYDNPIHQSSTMPEVTQILNIGRLIHQAFPESPSK